MTLLNFNNLVEWSTIPASGIQTDWFLTEWTAGWASDAKASFAWGIKDESDPVTGETEGVFNPYVDVYGYGYAYVQVKGENALVNLSAYLTPINIHLIDFELAFSNGLCATIKTFSQPLHFELNVNMGWRTCSFGVFEWISTDNKSTLETCPMTYYGTNSNGNDLPVWEFDLLNYLAQEFEYFSYCSTAEVPVQEPIASSCAEGVDFCTDESVPTETA